MGLWCGILAGENESEIPSTVGTSTAHVVGSLSAPYLIGSDCLLGFFNDILALVYWN